MLEKYGELNWMHKYVNKRKKKKVEAYLHQCINEFYNGMRKLL